MTVTGEIVTIPATGFSRHLEWCEINTAGEVSIFDYHSNDWAPLRDFLFIGPPTPIDPSVPSKDVSHLLKPNRFRFERADDATLFALHFGVTNG